LLPSGRKETGSGRQREHATAEVLGVGVRGQPGGRGPSDEDALAAAGGNNLGKVTHTMFAPEVGTVFQIQTPGGKSVAVSLAKATSLPQSTRKKARRTTFSLLFRGPTSPVLGQNTYDIQHGKLGAFKGVFVAYVGLDKAKKNSYYEVIFG
jgi:hypothetical protein